ncbi:hypothetical protein OHA21_39350 [Actinoplanes sp. NBC_00393]|uniref:hypothetical protein n=1 Tax=Actinoplanes sp. NBC_00393 TaxID=2975953 RepID=UPI002E1F3149
MSRQFRYRVAALMLSGLIFGAPLLTNGTASAEQVDESDRQVTFDGGVLGLSCESRPNVESLTVPAESVVKVHNRTGHDARLRLGGTSKGTVPENGSAEVVFRRGTTSVLLTPDCAVGGDVTPVLVTAEPSNPSTPDPVPAPSGGKAATMMSRPAGSPTDSRAGSALPDSASPAQRPARTAAGSSRPGTRKAAGSPPASATSAAQVSPRLKIKSMRGTAGVGAPAFAGMPPGERKTILPTTSASAAAADVPAVHHAQTATPTAEGVPVPETTVPVSGTVAEPVAAVGPIREGRPIGLLGLTALVCVIGVSTAAIRAIVSQRASRTNIA